MDWDVRCWHGPENPADFPLAVLQGRFAPNPTSSVKIRRMFGARFGASTPFGRSGTQAFSEHPTWPLKGSACDNTSCPSDRGGNPNNCPSDRNCRPWHAIFAVNEFEATETAHSKDSHRHLQGLGHNRENPQGSPNGFPTGGVSNKVNAPRRPSPPTHHLPCVE